MQSKKKNNNKLRDTTGYQVSNYRIIIRIRPWQLHLVHHGRLPNSLGVTNEKAPRSMHDTSDNLFDSYLQEYMWKKQHKDNIFGNILYWISFYYSM